jgi:hypothetical protein
MTYQDSYTGPLEINDKLNAKIAHPSHIPTDDETIEKYMMTPSNDT